MNSTKVAVVTGANKGIGYAIVKGLCKHFNGKVYLTSRDETRGIAAVNELKQMGLQPLFHKLDVSDEDSVKNFKEYIEEHDGGIDVLVNNAGITFTQDSNDSIGTRAEVTLATNYFGTLRVCEILFPLLRPNAQVVNISSALGHLSCIPSPNLRLKLSDPTLTIPHVSELMNQFIRDAKNNEHVEQGWGNVAYSVSKVGICALTIVQQKEFDKENRPISVNSVHPGYVDTDMTNHTGALTIDQGATAPLYLALGGHDLKGQYVWFDCSIADWYAPQAPKEKYKNFLPSHHYIVCT
ncbi:hypothetical protein RI129_002268 [Pyrocoelia pectoralis]|uniref:carbonyl reductase (NADPH) n=1 Tax=Pyrocoelia pectoralis TaxID=417401 RepID=A0AAN7ZSV3_9COLE